MSGEEMSRPIEILLVEDNPGDVRLIKEAFREGKVLNVLHVVEDGVEAMAFLRRQNTHAQAPRPGLILLDLNLPRKDGREVLAEIKGDENLKRIPVVILTSSKSEEDVFRTYNLHANAYVAKPMGLNEFMATVRSIEDFWLAIVKLPPNGERDGR